MSLVHEFLAGFQHGQRFGGSVLFHSDIQLSKLIVGTCATVSVVAIAVTVAIAQCHQYPSATTVTIVSAARTVSTTVASGSLW